MSSDGDTESGAPALATRICAVSVEFVMFADCVTGAALVEMIGTALLRAESAVGSGVSIAAIGRATSLVIVRDVARLLVESVVSVTDCSNDVLLSSLESTSDSICVIIALSVVADNWLD